MRRFYKTGSWLKYDHLRNFQHTFRKCFFTHKFTLIVFNSFQFLTSQWVNRKCLVDSTRLNGLILSDEFRWLNYAKQWILISQSAECCELIAKVIRKPQKTHNFNFSWQILNLDEHFTLFLNNFFSMTI